MPCILCRLLCQTVGNLCDTAAAFVLEQIDSVPECVHHRHEILAELRIIVVGITSVEITYLPPVGTLTICRMLVEPGCECLACITRHWSTLGYAYGLVQHYFGRLQTETPVDDRGERHSKRAYEIGVGDHQFAYAGAVPVFHLGSLYEVSNLDVAGTCHLATLAVEAILDGVIIEQPVHETVPLLVRT